MSHIWKKKQLLKCRRHVFLKRNIPKIHFSKQQHLHNKIKIANQFCYLCVTDKFIECRNILIISEVTFCIR